LPIKLNVIKKRIIICMKNSMKKSMKQFDESTSEVVSELAERLAGTIRLVKDLLNIERMEKVS